MKEFRVLDQLFFELRDLRREIKSLAAIRADDCSQADDVYVDGDGRTLKVLRRIP